jgi:hypothetical protein
VLRFVIWKSIGDDLFRDQWGVLFTKQKVLKSGTGRLGSPNLNGGRFSGGPISEGVTMARKDRVERSFDAGLAADDAAGIV